MWTKERPWYLFMIPSTFFVTVSPNVYYPAYITDLSRYKQVVAHENVHLKQQVANNKFMWFVKYIFLPRFRFQMEAEAMGMEAYIAEKYYAPGSGENVVQQSADNLSGWTYFFCATKSNAVDAIRAQWDYLKKNPPTTDPFDGMFDEKS